MLIYNTENAQIGQGTLAAAPRDLNNRTVTVDAAGRVEVKVRGRRFKVPVGRHYAGQQVRAHIDGEQVIIYNTENAPIGRRTGRLGQSNAGIGGSGRGVVAVAARDGTPIVQEPVTADGDHTGARGGKREPSPVRVPVVEGMGYWHERGMDQSRTGFVEVVGEVGDLTGADGGVRWEMRYAENMLFAYHSMEPDERMNNVWPMRQLGAVGHVDGFVADAYGFIDNNVRVSEVRLAQSSRSLERQLGVSPEAVQGLRDDVAAELDRLLGNSRLGAVQQAAPARTQPRRLGPGDVLAHEQMLVGQYGLFVTDPTALASNGRILGIYMGAVLHGEADEARVSTTHPQYERFLIDAGGSRGSGKVTTYSADGAGNYTAFANTALRVPAPGVQPAYDNARINARFVAYEVHLTDNQGRPRIEYVAALVGLNNLNVAGGDQVLISYGDRFLEQFKPTSARQQRAERRNVEPASKRPKTEPEEPGLAGLTPEPSRSAASSAPGPAAPIQDFRDYFVQNGLQPLVNTQRLSEEDASLLLNHLDQQLRANPNTDPQAVIEYVLLQLRQGAESRNEQYLMRIYDNLLRMATGRQGG